MKTTVPVAVAANFSAPMQKIAQAYEARTGNRLALSVGSTGALVAQVMHGAPYQVLLAADDRTALRLESEGLAVPGTRFVYATGRLVLWSADAGRVDAQGEVLRRDTTSRLAVANPKLAPYGAAALEVLDRMGVGAAWQGRLVQGENIAQAFQFVASGNAAMGFVAQSQVRVPGLPTQGSMWAVPVSLHSPLRQEAVLLRRGAAQPAARELLTFLRSDAARTIIRDYGYED